MSRISASFATLREQNKTALITYITAGDPAAGDTVELMRRLVNSGADLIELGVPFSDPMADGPVIQAAYERALASGITLTDVLDQVRRFREHDDRTPVVLMGYANPLEAMGYAEFAEAAADAGVDGVLVVDMPPEESSQLKSALSDRELDFIMLIAPTTIRPRLLRIREMASGFVYYVSLKGVTGSHSLNTDDVRKHLAELKQIFDLPVGVGFGIADAKSAVAVSEGADAVIIGSALVDRLAKRKQENDTAEDFLVTVRQALDNKKIPGVSAV
ncbi:MAG: tryptophan synthase subunit alpha [Gammaproteobacteria bacterium]|nr:tryptophan synthase subunit alpha [Gammaproteobacteria bacterium]